MGKVFYIYRHINKTTNEVFYIGKGTLINEKSFYRKYRRAFSIKKRSVFWENIVNKYGYEVEIMFETNCEKTIFKKEIELIALYGRRDTNEGTLVNLTNGGDGTSGLISNKKGVPRSEKDIQAIKLGMKDFSLTDEQKERHLINTPRGNKHPNFGKGYYMLGKSHSDETKRKMSGKTILCTESGKKWYNVGECAIENGLNRNTLKSRLNGRLKNNTTFIYV